MNKVWIAGVGMTAFGRRSDSLADMILEAARNAVESAGYDEFDAVYVGAMHPEGFLDTSNLASVITDYLGFVPAPAMRVESASSTGAALFAAGFHAVASGDCNRVLIVAGEVMTRVPTWRATELMAQVVDADERLHGATMPALAALATRRYMVEYGLNSEELALVAVKNHRNGVKNPYAQFRREISVDDVISSRMVSDPLRLYDCSPISDGAAALVLSASPSGVRVLGVGQATDLVAVQMRNNLTHFNSTRIAARKAFKMAGITPAEIGTAEIHDAFTSFEIIGSEDIGFFPAGGGRTALLDGITQPDGKLPVNASGGLKSRGHPVGTSGLAQIIEITLQLTGRAEYDHPSDARFGLTQSVGGLATNNLVTIMRAEE
ncbi:MAG: thiolase domain-containing protein [Candidatus Hydrogenedentota bacterium]